MMRITIIEPEAGGHHLVLYVRHIVREAVRREWDVHLITTEVASQDAAFRIVEREGGRRLSVSLMRHVNYPTRSSAVNLLNYQFSQHREFGRAFRASLAPGARPDIVYVSNLDYIDKAIALRGSPFGSTAFAGLILKPRFHLAAAGVVAPSTRSDRLYKALFARMLRVPSLLSVASIDEAFRDYVRDSGTLHADRVYYVPDVVAIAGQISRGQARAMLGIRDDQIVVLAYGQHSARKGIAELIAAVADPCCRPEIIVLLAGRQDASIRATLAGPTAQRLMAEGRLLNQDGFHDDDDEFRVHRAADIAWLGYRAFYGMSGVLILAGAMQLPVVTTHEGLVGWMTQRHGLGEIVDVSDAVAVANVLNVLATDPIRREGFAAAGATLAQQHTPSTFAGRICDNLAFVSRENRSV